MLIQMLDRFFRHEAFGGIILMLSAALALVFSNTALASLYDSLLHSNLAISFDGEGIIDKNLLHWINDGLMALFFFLVGLELKREALEGKLRDPRQIMMPGLAAIGGMALPAVIFAAINWNDPVAIHGWAIPAATDIAFALGVLALVGSRAPMALKIFLLTLAILDDLGAIVIIALFYTDKLSTSMLAIALLPIIGLFLLNTYRSHRGALYVLMGVLLWFCVLKSGVHATLAGVVAALFIPLRCKDGTNLLHKYETNLSPYVLYGVLPVFAFANAGVNLSGLSFADLFAPVPLGIALGLLIGKQLGVVGCVWLAVKAGLAQLPERVTWTHIYGVACLAGIGFTMSLFIGGLSYADPSLQDGVRIGVLMGSILSGVLGYLVLRMAPPATELGSEFEPVEAETAK